MIKYFKLTENMIYTHVTIIHRFNRYEHFSLFFSDFYSEKIFQKRETPSSVPLPSLLSQTYLTILKLGCIFPSLVLHVYFICIHKWRIIHKWYMVMLTVYLKCTQMLLYPSVTFCTQKYDFEIYSYRYMFIKFIHDSCCIILHCVSMPQLFIHSPMVGYLGFWLFGITINAEVNILLLQMCRVSLA